MASSPSTGDSGATLGTSAPGRRTVRRTALGVLLASIVVALIAGAPTVAAAQSAGVDCEVTAEETLAVKETAQQRNDELRRLAGQDGVRIPESILESVAYHIDQGNLLLQTEQYCEAAEHYRTAIDQAEAALIRGYTQQARLHLDAADAHLQMLNERGYVSFRTTRLDERVATKRDRLSDAESLAEARAVRNEARALAGEVATLPRPWLVDAVRFARSVWGIVVALVALLVAGVTGVVVQYRWSPLGSDEGDGPGPGGTEW